MLSIEEARAIFATADLPLYETQYRQLNAYLSMILDENTRQNLTRVTDPEEMWRKHFLDSAVLLQYAPIPLHTTCLDLGTGAGFPGIVLAIFRPDTQWTLLDSLQKRITFLENVAETLGLANVRCVHGRAEELGKNPDYREKFHYVTARAVAPMPVLLEYCLPFTEVGGLFVAMKGPSEHMDQKTGAILGGGEAQELEYTLEQVGARKLITVPKVEQTPPKYPRSPKAIRQKPPEREEHP